MRQSVGMLSALRTTLVGIAIVVVSLLLPPMGIPVVVVTAWMIGGTIAGLGLVAMAEHVVTRVRRQKRASA
jgi:uncharacterized membrane protein